MELMNATKALTLGAVLALSLAAAPAQAEEQAGIVKSASGAVEIERGGERIPASVGAPVFVSDVLATGADGAVGVTLRDSTILSLGANSELGLSEFRFNSQTMDGAAETALNAGTLSMLSGEIVKQNPGAVKITTPMAVLSVRGTKFAVQVEPGL